MNQQVYVYLSKLLQKCILTKSQSTVTVKGPVGDPPFENPDIQKIVSNFVLLKVRKENFLIIFHKFIEFSQYAHLRETSKLDFQIYTDLAKRVLHCINR